MNIFKKMYQEYFGYKLNETHDIEEAQLVNNISDYRGGVEYIINDPTESQSVAEEIRQWTTKKGFTIINHSISKSGKIGYFYFRLGDDPGDESQKIQGYFSQKPELKHFRFNIKTKKSKIKKQKI